MASSLIERRHGYSFATLPCDDKWHQFLIFARQLRAVAQDGGLPAAPDIRFANASPARTELDIGRDGLAVRGRGIHRPRGMSGSLSASAGPLYVSRYLRGWTASTAGRPYDGAVRVMLLLLQEAVPGVTLHSTGTSEEWDAAEEVAAQIAGRHLTTIPAIPLPAAEARLIADAAASPDVRVEPFGSRGLWRAVVRGAELAPVGHLAERRGSLAGFAGRSAALLAAAEAMRASSAARAVREVV